jgi:hypothetical protein
MLLRGQQLDRMTSAFVIVAALLVLASVGHAAVKSDAECAELGFISSICARANCAKLAEAVGNPGDGKQQWLFVVASFLALLEVRSRFFDLFRGFFSQKSYPNATIAARLMQHRALFENSTRLYCPCAPCATSACRKSSNSCPMLYQNIPLFQ